MLPFYIFFFQCRKSNSLCLKKEIDKKDSGFYIISTSKGVMTDEEVVLFNIGGEALLKIS